MKPSDARQLLIQRLEKDLIGPDTTDEVLENRPSDVYLTGILWPIGDRLGGEDDDSGTGGEEEDDMPSAPGIAGQQRPCTMGLSFATSCIGEEHFVDVKVGFATYEPQAMVRENGRRVINWARRASVFEMAGIRLPVDSANALRLHQAGLVPQIDLHIRGMRVGTELLSTVTVINRSNPEERNRQIIESHTMFQVQISITPAANTRIIARPVLVNASNIDDEITRLLFRDCKEFATGHQCSVAWNITPDKCYAESISSRWLPLATVPAVRANGHEVFEVAVAQGVFKAKDLASVPDDELIRRLRLVTEAYSEWIAVSYTHLTLPTKA